MDDTEARAAALKIVHQEAQASIGLLGFYARIEEVRRNPAMYLGEKSLRRFQMWLYGYQMAYQDLIGKTSEEVIEFWGFSEFVKKKCRRRDNRNWAEHIIQHCGDEADALDEFFTLLAAFRESKRKQRERQAKKVRNERA